MVHSFLIPYKWSLGANNLTTFLMLYVLVYYIRHYDISILKNKKLRRVLIFGGYAMAFLSIIFIDILGIRYETLNKYSCYYIRGDWRILPICISVGIFLWCANLKIRPNKIINTLGSLTFAVYLIHMHPLVLNLLFKRIFNIGEYMDSSRLILFVIGVTLIIFIGGVSVEQLRVYLFHTLAKIKPQFRKPIKNILLQRKN